MCHFFSQSAMEQQQQPTEQPLSMSDFQLSAEDFANLMAAPTLGEDLLSNFDWSLFGESPPQSDASSVSPAPPPLIKVNNNAVLDRANNAVLQSKGRATFCGPKNTSGRFTSKLSVPHHNVTTCDFDSELARKDFTRYTKTRVLVTFARRILPQQIHYLARHAEELDVSFGLCSYLLKLIELGRRVAEYRLARNGFGATDSIHIVVTVAVQDEAKKWNQLYELSDVTLVSSGARQLGMVTNAVENFSLFIHTMKCINTYMASNLKNAEVSRAKALRKFLTGEPLQTALTLEMTRGIDVAALTVFPENCTATVQVEVSVKNLVPTGYAKGAPLCTATVPVHPSFAPFLLAVGKLNYLSAAISHSLKCARISMDVNTVFSLFPFHVLTFQSVTGLNLSSTATCMNGITLCHAFAFVRDLSPSFSWLPKDSLRNAELYMNEFFSRKAIFQQEPPSQTVDPKRDSERQMSLASCVAAMMNTSFDSPFLRPGHTLTQRA